MVLKELLWPLDNQVKKRLIKSALNYATSFYTLVGLFLFNPKI